MASVYGNPFKGSKEEEEEYQLSGLVCYQKRKVYGNNFKGTNSQAALLVEMKMAYGWF